MPSPQAVVTFVAFLFVLLIGFHVPLELPAIPSAAASFILAIGAGWIVNRRVPDVDDDDVTEDARSSSTAPSTPSQAGPDSTPSESPASRDY